MANLNVVVGRRYLTFSVFYLISIKKFLIMLGKLGYLMKLFSFKKNIFLTDRPAAASKVFAGHMRLAGSSLPTPDLTYQIT